MSVPAAMLEQAFDLPRQLVAGIAAGDCRLPLVPPSDSAQTLLRAELARHAIDLKATARV